MTGITREGIWYAWRPVRLFAGPYKMGPWRWMCYVRRFRPMGLYWEYRDIEP